MDEEDNATLLIKYSPATGGKSPRSLIREGQCTTPGEHFVWRAQRCIRPQEEKEWQESLLLLGSRESR